VWNQGWQFQVVGRRGTNCVYPFFDQMEGRTGPCKISAQSTCGGGDEAECTYDSGCNVPKPTSFCFKLPPPPPPPPITG
jgi:hypothetical protein